MSFLFSLASVFLITGLSLHSETDTDPYLSTVQNSEEIELNSIWARHF